MCGIAGIYDLSWHAPFPAVERMVSALHHRGPDDRGFHASPSLAMGMTRLSIIDLVSGHQPISSEDGAVTVVCNGEIYNHLELRRELEAKGHRFRTRSDVEVIVHLYEDLGVQCLERLRGMFGAAIWDERRQKLVLARDRLGIKPLFYASHNGRVLFASEIKAIAQSGEVPLRLDYHALDRYLTLGYIPSPLTIYREIRKLEPGHMVVCEGGRVELQRYWRLTAAPDHTGDEPELARRFLDLFSDAVRSHLMSDVSLGAFLSGGVDSSLLVAIMSEHASEPVKTFTIGFGGQAGGYLDERGYARALSRRYGTAHTEFEVRPDLESILDEAVSTFDEPFADDSVIPTFHICRLAREHVTVALTGLGGDELFGGYERHLGAKLSGAYDRVPRVLREHVVAPLVGRIPERQDGHYTVNHLKRFVRAAALPPARRYLSYGAVFSDKMKRRVCSAETLGRLQERDTADDTQFFDRSPGDGVQRALYHDIHTYLPEDVLALSDRVSMRYGLELRVPFLDHALVEFCAAIPSRLKIRAFTKKYLLKRAAAPLLPPDILNHRKQGFASPMSAWMRTDLEPYVRETLSPARLARHGFFDHDAVGDLIDAHMTRREANDRQLFALIMFQKWHERFM
jgi:asparagine synthase (glutamine-hydrolysing)